MESTQFVESLNTFSSQYGSENSVGYVAGNIIGQPKRYPEYGDFTEACVFRTYGRWWKDAPDAWPALPHHSGKYQESDDFLELKFKESIYVYSVNIYETYNPGAVVRILALDRKATSQVEKWFTMFETKDHQPIITERRSRQYMPEIKPTPFPTDTICIEFIHDQLHYYTELDAVLITGSIDIDVDQLEGIRTVNSLTDEVSKLKLTESDVGSEPKSSTETSSDNGYFDTLPSEVLVKILCYLSADELGRVSTLSHKFYEHAYNALIPCNQHLNLKPYWNLIDKNAIIGFSKKCSRIQSLSLSWCGNCSDLFVSGSVINLMQSSLVRLELSACNITDDQFIAITKALRNDGGCNLRELDVSSTLTSLSIRSLQTIIMLDKLTRLNLYRTAVDIYTGVSIARFCTQLQFLNLGSCPYITDYDSVVQELGKNCHQLKSVDLWRARSLTSTAIIALVQDCRGIISLDLGWCSRISESYTSGNRSCIQVIADNCPDLRKLVLTANRSVNDADIDSLASRCPHLEQLDVLGNSALTEQALVNLLKKCKNMKFLDISFCSRINKQSYQSLVLVNPNCYIKKSFTTENDDTP